MYYHITENKPETIASILKEGLKADTEGCIFLFENISLIHNDVKNTIADLIAENQIFLPEYVMFEIDPKGITGELLNDNVAEFSSKWQWIVKQPKIEAKYLNLFGIYKTEYKPFM